MLLMFTFRGSRVRPRIERKRTRKVTTAKGPDFVLSPETRHRAQRGDATTGKLHELRKHFVTPR